MARGNIAQFAVKRAKRLKDERGRRRRRSRRQEQAGVPAEHYMPLLDHDQQATWGHPLDVRPSDLLPHLNFPERHFFKLIARGVLEGLKVYMKDNVQLNINCQDYQGYTPLVIAVKRNDEKIVGFLLTFSTIILGDALLHAVQIGNCYIVEMILDVMRKTGSEMSLPGCVESAEFSPDITPLILAAQCQHYMVVKLLLQRGHAINYPHPPECFCEDNCSWKHDGESLNESRTRYHSYQAIASPAYICQSSTDPVLTAFLLSRELFRCSKFEMELKTEYLQLSKEVSQLAVDLLHQCRTSREVELLLTRRTAPPGYRSPDDQPFPRVALAIDCMQKKFVAHPNAQHVLWQAWLGDCQHWRSLTDGGKLLRTLPRFFIQPFMILLYMVAPKSDFVKTSSSPLNKFISYTVSYLMFLGIIYIHNEMDSTSYVRGPPDTGLEPMVIIYVTSFLWIHIKMCWKQGPRKYLRQSWHWYDLVMLGLFYATFATWGWAWYDVYVYGHKYVPRRYWYQYDPTLVAEALYAVATIIAFGKLFYFFQIGSRLGPLQLSLSKMFRDIFDFVIVFLIVLVSFATGIHKLYNYYRGQVRRLDGEETVQSEAFLTSTMRNLFWALYGYSPPEFADVVLSEQTYEYNNETTIMVNKHKFTEAMGHILFGVYNTVAIVILLNLLIAIMSTSYIIVQENADEEWKFARTSVWMMFFEDGGTLPPPYNLVPTPRTIWYKMVWVYHKLRGRPRAKCSLQNCCYYDEEKIPLYTKRDYEKLMGQLVQRYLRYYTQMQLRERHLGESDLQYLLHGIPTQQAPPPLHTSSSSEPGEQGETQEEGTGLPPGGSVFSPLLSAPTQAGRTSRRVTSSLIDDVFE